MPTIHADTDIRDMITGTLRDLGRLKFTLLATRLTKYPALRRIMRAKKVQFDSGIGIQRTIMMDETGAARQTSLYDNDAVTVGDILTTINIGWRYTVAHYAYDRRELKMNRSPARIVDTLMTKRVSAFVALARHMENQIWGKPDDENNRLDSLGLLYWVPPNTTRGFYGGNPTGFSNVAGLDASTYDRWRSWTDTYTNVSKSDLIRSMRIAHRSTDFEPPVEISDYRRGSGDDDAIYVNLNTITAMEELGESQNENLGKDLASMDGSMVFRRTPIEYVPFLDSDTTDPVIMLRWAFIYPVFMEGEFLRETEPLRAPWQHNLYAIFIDSQWNILCVDRRAQARIAKAA